MENLIETLGKEFRRETLKNEGIRKSILTDPLDPLGVEVLTVPINDPIYVPETGFNTIAFLRFLKETNHIFSGLVQFEAFYP